MPDISANREYKDSVFTWLFKEKEKLVSLYNALSGSSLPPDTDVEIATLTNVLFNSWRNDIAFVIEGRLVILIEHHCPFPRGKEAKAVQCVCKYSGSD